MRTSKSDAKQSAIDAATAAGTALELASKAGRKAAAAETDAGNAAVLASGASFAANTVDKKARGLETRINDASAKVDAVDKSVSFFGPRSWLFAHANGNPDANIGLLKPFTGQKIVFRTELSKIVDPAEQAETRDLILELKFLLGWQIAGWDISEKSGFVEWGTQVLYSSEAPEKTKAAAQALAKVLKAVGLTDMQRSQQAVLEEVPKWGTLAREDVSKDEIILAIGKHP